MKIVYISFINETIKPGYVNKIHGQAKSFSLLNCETWLISRENTCFKTLRINEDVETVTDKISINTVGLGIKKYLNYISSLRCFFKYCKNRIASIKPDAVYIRRIRPITPMMLRFIRRLRKDGIVVLYEYPTYPWKEDLILSKQYLTLAIDTVLYPSLKKRINAMVCMGHCEQESCDVIETINGVSHISIGDNKPVCSIKSNEIYMVCVCHYTPVHGIEKVLKGMKNYYNDIDGNKNSYKFKLRIVGPIEDFSSVKNIVEYYNIAEYVEFTGFKTGAELDDIYDSSNIGLDAIALEIRGEKCICGSLKSREYISKGIPFVCSDLLDLVNNSQVAPPPFMFVLDHKHDDLDIKSVIDWYINLECTRNDIKDFGNNTILWVKTMKPVVDYCIKNINK